MRPLFSFKKTIGIGIFVLIISTYTLFESRRFLEGPLIQITGPETGQLREGRLLVLEAITKNVNMITVNGRETYVTDDGLLQEHIWLPEGYTVLTLAARDRFGHETRKTLELYTD